MVSQSWMIVAKTSHRTGMGVAVLSIFIRSIFRLAAFAQGSRSALAYDEVAFMALEGTMMVLATVCLTIFHPGLCFGGQWNRPSSVFSKSHRHRRLSGGPNHGGWA